MWITVVDSGKFEFNDIITLLMKNDSERGRFVSPGFYFILYLYCIISNIVDGKLN